MLTLAFAHFEEHEEYGVGILKSEILLIGFKVLSIELEFASHHLTKGEVGVSHEEAHIS